MNSLVKPQSSKAMRNKCGLPLRQAHVTLGRWDDGGGGMNTPARTTRVHSRNCSTKTVQCLCHGCCLDCWYTHRLPYQITSKHQDLKDLKGQNAKGPVLSRFSLDCSGPGQRLEEQECHGTEELSFVYSHLLFLLPLFFLCFLLLFLLFLTS